MDSTSAYLLALLSAAFYGAGDFVGGVTSRRASALVVLVIAQAGGMVALIPFLPVVGGTSVSLADLSWGAAAGIAGGAGVALLYRALATGTMAVVAPTSAALAVLVPVGVDVSAGTELSARTVAGIVLALVAIVLVGQARREPSRTRRVFPPGLVLSLWSGIAIGIFFLLLARSSKDAGLWPLAAARLSSVVLFSMLAVASGSQLRLPRRLTLAAIGCGVLDMAANALYLLAAQRAELSVVVTLASLYPASTVILARFVLHERLTMAQRLGIGVALIAIVLIAGAR